MEIRKTEQSYENYQICHRPAPDPRVKRHLRAFLRAKTGFCSGIRNLGVLPDGCRFFKGRTTGFPHDAARNNSPLATSTQAQGPLTTSADLNEADMSQIINQIDERPVPTQCRRRANFRAALLIRASNPHNRACEIRLWISLDA